MNKLKQALKDDFKKLYQPQFTTTWEAERLVRETEIDVMELQAIEAYIAEQTRLARIDELNMILSMPDEHGDTYSNVYPRLDHLSKKAKDE